MRPDRVVGAGEAVPVVATVSRDGEVLPAYGLHRPDLAEARAAVERVCGERAGTVWADALRRCGASADPGGSGSGPSLPAMIDALTGSGDPVVALCARALAIRLSSFEHLAATQDLVRGDLGRRADT